MTLKIYEYDRCSTCRKALQFLEKKNIEFKKVAIVEHPPTKNDLQRMLKFVRANGGDLKNLFNTSGQLYREMNVSDRLKNGMTEKEALDLLSTHGKLVKRPFVLTQKGGLLGFKEEEWKIHFR